MKYFLGFTPVSFRVMMFAFTIFFLFFHLFQELKLEREKKEEKTNKQK